jgi:bifunctional non-homologous end joining protein LigD
MQTPDGVWRVEVYQRPRSRDSWWYRLVNVPNDSVVEDLSIAAVQRLLAEAGVDVADLVEVDQKRDDSRHGAA